MSTIIHRLTQSKCYMSHLEGISGCWVKRRIYCNWNKKEVEKETLFYFEMLCFERKMNSTQYIHVYEWVCERTWAFATEYHTMNGYTHNKWLIIIEFRMKSGTTPTVNWRTDKIYYILFELSHLIFIVRLQRFWSHWMW